MAAVEGRDDEGLDGITIDAAGVHAHTVRVRAWNIKRLDAAMGAEIMLGNTRVERVRGQVVAAANEPKAAGLHDQV